MTPTPGVLVWGSCAEVSGRFGCDAARFFTWRYSAFYHCDLTLTSPPLNHVHADTTPAPLETQAPPGSSGVPKGDGDVWSDGVYLPAGNCVTTAPQAEQLTWYTPVPFLHDSGPVTISP